MQRDEEVWKMRMLDEILRLPAQLVQEAESPMAGMLVGLQDAKALAGWQGDQGWLIAEREGLQTTLWF